MLTEDSLQNFRQIMVTAINPTICILGCLANIFNMIIFTRKHMRSSTNIYLTALAFADFFYLFFSLSELFNYQRFSHFYVAIYFYSYGTIVWLKEAFSYISISITVSFTIERYIAVRYPIHRQRYCTETIAKRVIIALFLFCILGTIAKPFEFKFVHKTKGYNSKTGNYCDQELACLETSQPERIELARNINDTSTTTKFICNDAENNRTFELNQNDVENCKKIDYYKTEETDLRFNTTYVQIYSIVVTIIFVLIPLIVLIVFNSLLIHIVHEASKLREKLTQVPISRSDSGLKKNANEIKTISQENKITIVLISIVVVFLLCQIPWAIYVIFLYFTNILSSELAYFLAIILNTLVDINSAINLILYCGLSEDYRKTSKKLLRELTFRASSTASSSSNKQKSMSTLADHTIYTS
ncbi:thyrotropin-releasing hormone receptor-like [Condylostylus longicornis]|uniref:thyrotropin-releasing hormone receptor-like n=1 Tax=Condylostylus longicornis TaxID=2530218 RepID=UPI00244E3925|nr:thyrotropin-releasing hormone receptor-like [Condylostylus longicornis]